MHYLPERIQVLRQRCVDAVPEVCVDRARLITEAYGEFEAQTIQMKRALAFEKILNEMSIYIQDGELIVGNHSSKLRAAPIFPEYDVSFIREEIEDFASRPGDPFVIHQEAKRELLRICAFWEGKTVRQRVASMLPEDTRLAGEEGVAAYDSAWTLFNGDGHIAPDYPKVLLRGMKGIIEEIDDHLGRLDFGIPSDLAKYEFLNAAKICCLAMINFAKRFAQLALELAHKEEDETRRAELERIARVCQEVPENPASSFQEALQSLWLVHLAVQLETNGHSVSLGRFDQYAYPYYAHDIETGVLSREEALELMQCFWLKLSELTKIRPTDDANLFPGYPMFQNLTIGGQTPEGLDATNELTLLALCAQATVRLVQPNLTARVHKKSPREYLIACTNVIRMGMGFPSLFCDEIIIKAMLHREVAIEDAYDYCLVGCVEPSVQGKWGGRYGAGLTNISKILEVALHGGRDPRSGLCLCPDERDLSQFKSFNEVLETYRKQVHYYTRHRVVRDNIQDIAWRDLAPTPFLDSLVQDCIGRGKGQKDGGAVYDYTGGETGNIANVANSLAVIKKLVFDEGKISGKELLDAIDSNFEGHGGEILRQMVINHVPKYGNDEDYVDLIAKEAFRIYITEPPKYLNTRYGLGPVGGRFHPSTASISANVPFGLVTGAMPDGRKAWEPLADVTSPFRGTDLKGPTAAVKSVSKLDNYLLSGGTILNIKLNPSLLGSDEGVEGLINLVKTFFDLGGMEIQFNVISRETLREAQKKPEEYRDLIVRVAGYSAYFVVQDPRVQEDIIERTEHVQI
jgi:formate C-acetyltransferase